MLTELFKRCENIVHCVFVPVVHAQTENEDDSSVSNRLRKTFKRNQYLGLSPEVTHSLTIIQNAGLLGTVLGGVINGKNQYMDFMENATASKYDWHVDAKAELSRKIISGAVRGSMIWGIRSTALSIIYVILLNYIPVLRNEHGWIEHVTSSLVTGTIAGHLFSDSDALGFQQKKPTGRLSHKQLCLARGVSYGLLFGIVSATYSHISKSGVNAEELRNWEKYWKRRLKDKQAESKQND